MIHLLTCSNEFEIEGLIAVTGKYLRPEHRVPYRQSKIQDDNAAAIAVDVPQDAAGKQLHLILEASDDSDVVPLVDYRRAVIDVAGQKL